MKIGKDNPLQVYVDNFLSASRKGASLTQSLLTFSRQNPIALNPVNLNDVVRGTTKLLNRLVTEDVRVKTVFSPDANIIMADVSQIDQILFNLATNARDAMPRGGTLTIETGLIDWTRTPPGSIVSISRENTPSFPSPIRGWV